MRHVRRIAAPLPHERGPLWRAYAAFTVVPNTNLTGLSVHYQSYLNDIFHTSLTARLLHALCMTLTTTAALCWFAEVPLGAAGALPAPLADAAWLGAAALGLWYLAWGAISGNRLWGVLSVGLVAGLWALGRAWGAARVGAELPLSVEGLLAAPHLAPAPLVMLVSAAVQAWSHLPEPMLPPRINGDRRWIPLRTFLLGTPEQPLRLATIARRLAVVTFASAAGTVDEFIATPRLLPLHVLELMWMAGYRPEQRARWKAMSAAAVASGNPALDYVGIGGATLLRDPDAAA